MKPLLLLLLMLSLGMLGFSLIAQQRPEDEGFDISDFDEKPAVKVAPAKPDVQKDDTKAADKPVTPAVPDKPPMSDTNKPAETSKTSLAPIAVKPQTTTAKEAEPQMSEEGSVAGAGTLRFNEDRTTRYLTLSGALGVSYIFRDKFFSSAALGNNYTDFDADFFDPRITLNLTVQMEKNIRGVLELQNEERDAILHRTSLGNHYITNRAPGNEFRLQVEKAYIEVAQFLTTGLTFKGGIIPFKRALRANGESFFIDLGEAESPFSTRADTHAAGVVTTWQPIQQVQFYADAFYLVTAESSFRRQDETVAGINIDLDMTKEARGDDESRIDIPRFFNLLFAVIQSGSKTVIWNFGGGFSYFFSGDPQTYLIEIYSELLFQFGEYAGKNRAPAFTLRDQQHLALGTYGGFKFAYQASPFKPFLDVSAWYISGDDDDPSAKKNRDLVTYENIRSTLIMEENDYGLDVDSNYWAVKIEGGVSLTPLLKEEVRLKLLYAHFETIDAPPHRTHRLGEEIDVRLSWEYSSDLSFALNTGILWNSAHFKQVLDEVGGRGKEHAFLLQIETFLRF
jgi:hypothetical protein